MKDTIRYYDRNNVLRLTLNEYPYYSEPSDLKDWIWGFNEQFGVINTFYRNKTEYELVVGIAGDYLPHHDALCDIFSADVIANEPGYLELRGWRLPCYIVEASYEYGLSLDRQAKFRVRSVNSTWIRTNTRSYNGVPGGGLGGEDLGRDYIFSYVPPEKYEDMGEIIKIENDEGDLTLTSLSVSLSPIQEGSGTPSPTNIRPISGRTEVVTQRTGVNVWDEEWELGGFNADGSQSAVQDRIRSKNYIPCVGNASYYIKQGALSDTAWSYFVFYDESKSVIGSRVAVYGTFTTPSNARYMKFNTNNSYGATYHDDISINYPSTDHDYHAHDGQTYTTALGRTVYGGTLDVVSGVLTVDRRYVTVADFTLWGGSGTSAGGLHWVNVPTSYPAAKKGDENICSHGAYVAGDNEGWASMVTAFVVNTATFPARIYVASSSLSAFQTEYASLQAVYELATPQTYQLTPQQVSLLVGENNLWTNTGGTIDVKYETISVPFPARGYNYGYSQPESHADVINLPGTGNGYEIIVYGPQTNPVIYLNNQPVQVNVELSAQQRLRIVSNGSVKTIEILSSSGQATDAFVYRDKENTPFLTLGTHTDLSFGQIRFDFTTIERRSEPTWT